MTASSAGSPEPQRYIKVPIPEGWYGVSGVVILRGVDGNDYRYARVKISDPDEATQVGLLMWGILRIVAFWYGLAEK